MKAIKISAAMIVLLIFVAAMKPVGNAGSTTKANGDSLKLVWSDEFDKDGSPDSTKWGYDLGAGGWGNNEAEYYTSREKNAEVKNGLLNINLIKEPYNGSAYTSARLLTKNKFSFTYGTVKVRAKLPSGGGTWPAIWMLGNDPGNIGWPGMGEIDIMEHLGNKMNTIYGTLHYPGRSGDHADGATRAIENASTAFHIYQVDWSASVINISVDGQVIHSVSNSNKLPFNHDFFIILNVAMGGNFGGAIDAAVSQASMQVDYVRVYQ